jgi:serine/threonine protein kinase
MIHGDLKPSNIMLKRSGTAKVVDFGSATELGEVAPYRKWTPLYAAVEVMLGGECTPRSDLCSLGYVLVELLAGRSPFAKADSYKDLVAVKRDLPHRLGELLPAEVVGNRLLMQFIMGLIAPDPAHRFVSAEAADLSETGAAAFHRQLVHGNLSCEYQNDLRLWVQSLGEVPPFEGATSLKHATSVIIGSVSSSSS